MFAYLKTQKVLEMYSETKHFFFFGLTKNMNQLKFSGFQI